MCCHNRVTPVITNNHNQRLSSQFKMIHHNHNRIWHRRFDQRENPSWSISRPICVAGFYNRPGNRLTSTIDLQNMSSIWPLVMEIDQLLFYRCCVPLVWGHHQHRHYVGHGWTTTNHENIKLIYLHHQWSDRADILQFDSTGGYFKTVEYERERTIELRDNTW